MSEDGNEGIEVWRGAVAAWECDLMGHLNVGFYVARAMEGLVGLAAGIGMPDAFSPNALATLIVREQHIRFMREARAGAPLRMSGGVLEIGETEARLLLVMRHHSGEIAATFQILVAHATAREGRPFPWPARVLARARPRSIATGPVQPAAGIARAEALGLRRLAAGAIGPADCDAFGRMRADRFMNRLSDGVQHLFADGRPGASAGGPRLGGAALEYRLIHLGWPRAGDRVDLRSGFAGTDARFRRLIHWLLDPATGRPWGVAEALVTTLDLDARKIHLLDDQALAAAQAQVVEGLTL